MLLCEHSTLTDDILQPYIHDLRVQISDTQSQHLLNYLSHSSIKESVSESATTSLREEPKILESHVETYISEKRPLDHNIENNTNNLLNIQSTKRVCFH